LGRNPRAIAVEQNHLSSNRKLSSFTIVIVLVNPAVSINSGATRISGISLIELLANFAARFWQKTGAGSVAIVQGKIRSPVKTVRIVTQCSNFVSKFSRECIKNRFSPPNRNNIGIRHLS
jgi:hypothetical protein